MSKPKEKSKCVCERCTKNIATRKVSCQGCKKFYHPGCVDYIAPNSDNACCIANLQAGPRFVFNSDENLHQFTESTQSTFVNAMGKTKHSPPPSASGNRSGNRDEDISEILETLRKLDLQNISAKLDRIEVVSTKIDSFMEKQTEINEEMNAKLDNISEILLKVRRHDDQIAKLNEKVENLTSAHSTHNANTGLSSPVLSADLVVAGVPCSIARSPREIAELVFASLGVTYLLSDILDVKELRKKALSRAAADSTRVGNEGINIKSNSYIVMLKSVQVRDFIISKKRKKPVLKVSDVFADNTPGMIYVNEFLPPEQFSLLIRTKAKAAATSCRYVWVKLGHIFVRREDGSPIMQINSDTDLSKLE